MKVLVTGGAGNIGEAVARDLLEAGHSVRILDRAAPASDLRAQCEMVYLDLTDRLGLLRALEGCEAIAHLAAIPNPVNGNDLELFPTDVVGTQYLLAAAESHDIQRVALASSGSIYGFPFQKNGNIGPQYLPLDEAHPILNQDVYALSKQCNELTAATYTRRAGMATTCFRISRVVDLARDNPWMKRWLERAGTHKDADLWSYVERRDVARARFGWPSKTSRAAIMSCCWRRAICGAKAPMRRPDGARALRRTIPICCRFWTAISIGRATGFGTRGARANCWAGNRAFIGVRRWEGKWSKLKARTA